MRRARIVPALADPDQPSVGRHRLERSDASSPNASVRRTARVQPIRPHAHRVPLAPPVVDLQEPRGPPVRQRHQHVVLRRYELVGRGALRRRRRAVRRRQRRAADPVQSVAAAVQHLKVPEKENVVVHDRPSHARPELVLVIQQRLPRREPVRRRQSLAAIVFVRRPVKIVRPAARHRVHHSAPRVPELRRIIGRQCLVPGQFVHRQVVGKRRAEGKIQVGVDHPIGQHNVRRFNPRHQHAPVAFIRARQRRRQHQRVDPPLPRRQPVQLALRNISRRPRLGVASARRRNRVFLPVGIRRVLHGHFELQRPAHRNFEFGAFPIH